MGHQAKSRIENAPRAGAFRNSLASGQSVKRAAAESKCSSRPGKRSPIAPTSSDWVNGAAYDTPFSNKAWVLVRKGGAAQVIKAKYSRLNVIYNRQSFKIPQTDNQFQYLEPK